MTGDEIRNLQQRVTWLERQWRMLVNSLDDKPPEICRDSRCLNGFEEGGTIPHIAEQPVGCPRLPS